MELIKIYQGNVVSARELYDFLGLKKDFTSWFKNMIKYGFEEGKDFTPFQVESTGGRPRQDYALKISCAKEISMLQRTDKGKEARLYFIEAEETLALLRENKRFEAFKELEETKVKFRSSILEKGFTDEDYIEIDMEGSKVLLNGEVVEDKNLETILLKARDFATSTTLFKLDKMDTSKDILDSNKDNHLMAREHLLKNNIVPEKLSKKEALKLKG